MLAAHQRVYELVSIRDPWCRACGQSFSESCPSHRHHLRGRKYTTVNDVCCLCAACHAGVHPRVGGKTLKIYGDADARDAQGKPNGLTVERVHNGPITETCYFTRSGAWWQIEGTAQ